MSAILSALCALAEHESTVESTVCSSRLSADVDGLTLDALPATIDALPATLDALPPLPPSAPPTTLPPPPRCSDLQLTLAARAWWFLVQTIAGAGISLAYQNCIVGTPRQQCSVSPLPAASPALPHSSVSLPRRHHRPLSRMPADRCEFAAPVDIPRIPCRPAPSLSPTPANPCSPSGRRDLPETTVPSRSSSANSDRRCAAMPLAQEPRLPVLLAWLLTARPSSLNTLLTYSTHPKHISRRRK